MKNNTSNGAFDSISKKVSIEKISRIEKQIIGGPGYTEYVLDVTPSVYGEDKNIPSIQFFDYMLDAAAVTALYFEKGYCTSININEQIIKSIR